MLEKIDLSKKMKKPEYKEKIQELSVRLGELQRACRTKNIPVMIVFEGLDASGKGVQISKLIQALDPRGFEVFAVKKETEEEKFYPYMKRFWTKIPERGKMSIFDTSWYRKVLGERFENQMSQGEVEKAYDTIQGFEKELTDDGMVIIKLFLYISKREQKKRFEKLAASKESAWRVTGNDWRRNEEYDAYLQVNEEMLAKTDTAFAPWTIVEATDKRYASVKIYKTVIEALENALENTAAEEEKAPELDEKQTESVLDRVDLSLSYTKEEYEKKKKKLQKELGKLHGELYRRRIPMVLGFEGWDAGGKGGAIKRLTQALDPRGCVVIPTATPNDWEKSHHYLWRFWIKMPKKGHIAIFDRTWYGRVMVERIEGFCTKQEWKRAYKEMNDMEAQLVDSGAIVMKFWMQIDKDEQERRFRERQENPAKQWKITDEDWRNREKWDLYERAVEEMLVKTSTPHAPWIIVEGNNKYYARIKVLETVVDAIRKRLDKEKEK
nr:polyphosphate:AMP phosphotransferase [uncultured Sellimonas sp.]